MEARLEAIPSQTRLWWSKLGQWQVLTTGITLATFFVTLGITGDTKVAIIAVAVVVLAVFTVTAADIAGVVITGATTAGAVTTAIAGVTAGAFAIAFTAIAIAIAFAPLIAVEVPGISKRAVWLSYAGEFLLILLPMLWALHG